jgi:hypothetical protein
MPNPPARLYGGILAVLILGSVSGCSANVSVGTPPSSALTPDQALATSTQPQRPGTCKIAPPRANLPTGEWTANETILTTGAIDACAGERLVRPWDFRRVCTGGTCETHLYTASYYGPEVAKIVPAGRERWVATFQPTLVPCPHRPGEDTGTNHRYATMTLWWSSHGQILQGLKGAHQIGPCGGGPEETSSYVARRTHPAASPPAEGP